MSHASATSLRKVRKQLTVAFTCPSSSSSSLWQKECVWVEQHQGIAGGKINDSTVSEPQRSTAMYTEEANHRGSIYDALPLCCSSPSSDRPGVSLFDIQHSKWVLEAAAAKTEGKQPSSWPQLNPSTPPTHLPTQFGSSLSLIFSTHLSPPSRSSPHQSP